MFIGDIFTDKDKTVTVQGSYGCGSTTVIGTTTINGNMNISDGQVTIENLKLQ